MDFPTILSRRSMLKASSCLVAGAAIAPVAAVAASHVPQVLTLLLVEYEAAAVEHKNAQTDLDEARRRRADMLDKAYLYVEFPRRRYARLGESFQAYYPEYAAAVLKEDMSADLAIAAEDSAEVQAVRKKYALARRRLARQVRKYRAIEARSGYPEALERDKASYRRFHAAHDALAAYRPVALAEVAAIIRATAAVGPFVGYSHGINVRDIADMLDIEVAL
ncbi:MAG: hypothetical protein ABS75_07335 [Pelagibacterium sp. SCN 63-23]|nr:MAG: hypothetical protein ABS75_07335 [Pelagibacterium sp. SCN 63-23]